MGKPYHIFKYKNTGLEKFTIIGHRGACHYFPENTIVSLNGAVGMGAEMVEIDVQLTKDGIPVVFHDEELDRCTDGRGRLAMHTLAELKRLDAGSWFDKKFKGERIPTLEEVLEFCRDRIALNIEIKTEAVTDRTGGGVEEKCIELAMKNGMSDHVVYSSFDPRVFHHFKELNAEVPAAVLYNSREHRGRLPSDLARELGASAFNCSAKELTPQWMEDCRRSDVPVHVYTINDEDTMREFVAMGVSGIFTNRPDVLAGVVRGIGDRRWGA
jgi:glycerophosphoryl diester phosphodiesterase